MVKINRTIYESYSVLDQIVFWQDLNAVDPSFQPGSNRDWYNAVNLSPQQREQRQSNFWRRYGLHWPDDDDMSLDDGLGQGFPNVGTGLDGGSESIHFDFSEEEGGGDVEGTSHPNHSTILMNDLPVIDVPYHDLCKMKCCRL